MIALIAAILLQDAYAGIGTPVPPPPPGFYLTQYEVLAHRAMGPDFDQVAIGDWVYQATGADGSVVMLTRPARAQRQIWVRYEYAAGADREVMSERALVEVNCTDWKTRKVQVDLFSESNLTGRPTSITTPSEWTIAAPDTVAELQLEAVCPH